MFRKIVLSTLIIVALPVLLFFAFKRIRHLVFVLISFFTPDLVVTDGCAIYGTENNIESLIAQIIIGFLWVGFIGFAIKESKRNYFVSVSVTIGTILSVLVMCASYVIWQDLEKKEFGNLLLRPDERVAYRRVDPRKRIPPEHVVAVTNEFLDQIIHELQNIKNKYAELKDLDESYYEYGYVIPSKGKHKKSYRLAHINYSSVSYSDYQRSKDKEGNEREVIKTGLVYATPPEGIIIDIWFRRKPFCRSVDDKIPYRQGCYVIHENINIEKVALFLEYYIESPDEDIGRQISSIIRKTVPGALRIIDEIPARPMTRK